MNRVEEVESLLGAFALDALSLEERRRVGAALAADPALRAEADSLLEVAAVLAAGAVEDTDRPPASLWAAVAAATAPPARAGRTSWRTRLSAAVAVTALAAGVALGFVAIGQHGRILEFKQSPLAAAAETARSAEGATVVPLSGEITAEAIVTADGTGYLLTPDIPGLPDDQTYQLWVIVGDRVISAGILGTHPAVSGFHVSGTVAGFALTVEVAGGVISSQQDPVAVGLVTR